MRVLIPSPLRSYTNAAWVDARGSTLADALADLDRQYPGIRFRMIDEQEKMRRHVRFFVNGEQTFDLARPLRESDEVCIVQALSGGRVMFRLRSHAAIQREHGRPRYRVAGSTQRKIAAGAEQ